MSKEIKEIIITQQDLIDWIDRPPSNEDIDLINYIVNRLENFYKLQQEKEALIDVAAEHLQNEILYKSRCKKAIARIRLLGKYNGEYCTRNFKMMSADFNDLLNILQGSDK